jgi:hypothetical protein
MNPINARTLGLLLSCAALAAACDRSGPAQPSDPAPAAAPATLAASDAACRLPLRHFGRSRMELVGTVLDPPLNLVIVDRVGQRLWNSVPVEARVLEEYATLQAQIAPPPFLVVEPTRDAPCAVVQETLAVAVRAGRCRPERCAFQWPGTDAPPPPASDSPPLPDRTLLLGNWILASIDGAPPPSGAPPVEVIFTDGAIGAKSQCVTWDWLVAVDEDRLRVRASRGAAPSCERMRSPWEEAFEGAMESAARIESDGRKIEVTGAGGRLKLKRPDGGAFAPGAAGFPIAASPSRPIPDRAPA